MNTKRMISPVAYCLLGLSLLFAIPAGAQPTLTTIPVITTFKNTGGSSEPFGLATDSAGNVFIADRFDHVIRKVDAGGNVTVVAGISGSGGYNGDAIAATAAQLNQPRDVELDAAGNLYIADTANNRVRIVNTQASGNLVAFGVTVGPGNIGSVPGLVTLDQPFSIALDRLGNMYVADFDNHSIRKVDSLGVVTTTVGDGAPGAGGDGGPAVSARLQFPKSVAVDARGNLYIADSINRRIRVVNTQSTNITVFTVTIGPGDIKTVAGTGTQANSGDGGIATSADIEDADGIVVDSAGDLYIAAGNDHTVRFVNVATGTISAFASMAGGSGFGNGGDNGPATAALMNKPFGLALDFSGNLYIADTSSQAIRKVSTSAGFTQTALGSAAVSKMVLIQFSAAAQSVAQPTIPASIGGVSEFSAGTPVCADNGTGTFCSIPVTFQPKYPGARRIPLQLAVTNVGITTNYTVGLTGVGVGPQVVLLPGTISTTTTGLSFPFGFATDAAGNVYVSEGDVVRKISAGGTVATLFAGTPGAGGSSGDGSAATSARLGNPSGLAVDAAGNVYIADSGNDRVRKVGINGIITTFAGGGGSTGDGVPATSAQLSNPNGVTVDPAGNVYISNNLGGQGLRKVIAATGLITTVVGTLSSPFNLAADSAGNVYIAEAGNNLIKKLDTAGIVTTVAGGGASTADGVPATTAALSAPLGVAVDAADNFYFAEFARHVVRKVDAATGNISTVSGTGTSGFSGDGGPANLAQLDQPAAVALDSLGNLYIADAANNLVRKVTASAANQVFPTTPVSTTSAPRNVTISNIGNQDLTLTNLVTSANFGTAVTTTCTSSILIESGDTCLLALTFAPTTAGAKTGTSTATDDTLNIPGSTQTVNLSGTTPITATTTTMTSTAPTATYGTPVTFTATVTPVSPGTVTFVDTLTSTVLAANVALNGSGQATVDLTQNVGAYAVAATYNPDSTHSTSTSAPLPLTVTKKALLLSADPKTRLYGGTNPTFTGTLSGFVRSENGGTNNPLAVTHGVPLTVGVVTGAPSITTSATTTTPVSTPPIVAALGTLSSPNYSFTFNDSTLNITPAPLLVTVNNVTKAYMDPVPPLTGTLTGLVAGDTEGGTILVNYSTSATASSAPGTYPITAVVSGSSASNYSITNPGGTLTIPLVAQTITFNTLPSKTFGDPPFLINATGGGSGNPVTFSSPTSEVCTVSGNTVTLVAAGGCAINADQAGNSTYAAASTVSQSFVVSAPGPVTPPPGSGSMINQTITFNSLSSRTPDEPPFDVSATGGGSGNAVTFASTTTSVCTVSGNTVTLLGPGTCTIAASQNGNSQYNAAVAVLQSFIVGCNLTNTGSVPCSTTSTGYSFADRGGTAFSSIGGSNDVAVGYGLVTPTGGTTAPTAFAIFGYTANGVLVSEAAVPAMQPILSGRIYAQIDGAINTGIAFANSNSAPVTISFYFTDQSGVASGASSLVIDSRGQLARFLDQSPFNKTGPFIGTLTFEASAPVGVIALRTFTNERNDFTYTTQTVAPTIPGSNSALVMAHFADGGGWKTEVLLVNSSDQAISGAVQFMGEGSAGVAATPLEMRVNGQTGVSFDYTIPARASINLQTANLDGITQVGSVRVTPSGSFPAPSGYTLFSYKRNGVTVSRASVPAQFAGSTFRAYVESSGVAGTAGSIRSGIAITNTSASPATINLEMTTLSGAATGITGSVSVPANGHIARSLDELLPGFTLPARGVLRIISGQNSIVVTGLRARYNERGDYLITTTPAVNELSPPSSGELVFPHIVNLGGYTMQFILFSGSESQTGQGTVFFYDHTGQALTLTDQ